MGLQWLLTAKAANTMGCSLPLPCRVSGVVEGAAEGIDGIVLEAESEAEAESDVGVEGGGDADVALAEEFLDHDESDALFQEQGPLSLRRVADQTGHHAGCVQIGCIAQPWKQETWFAAVRAFL